jgi:hypothetical protein
VHSRFCISDDTKDSERTDHYPDGSKLGLAKQLDMLHTWLAAHPRPAGTSVSVHLQQCAAADPEARRILTSGLDGSSDDGETPEAPSAVPASRPEPRAPSKITAASDSAEHARATPATGKIRGLAPVAKVKKRRKVIAPERIEAVLAALPAAEVQRIAQTLKEPKRSRGRAAINLEG